MSTQPTILKDELRELPGRKESREPAGRASPRARSGLGHAATIRAKEKWSSVETFYLLAMRREGVERKVIARVLGRTPAAVKAQLERIQ